MKRFSIGFCIVALLGLAGLYLWQAAVASAEKERLSRLLHEREREIEMGRAAQEDREKLQQEIDDCQMKLGRLRKILPEQLAVEEFLGRVQATAEDHGVSLHTADPRVVGFDFYEVADIGLELEGPPGAAAALIDEVRQWPRLVRVEGLAQDDGKSSVRLIVFASPDAKREFRFVPCKIRETRVWFPGLRGPVQELNEKVKETCAEVDTLADDVDMVNQLYEARAELEVLSSIAEELSSKHRAPTDTEQIAATGESIQ
ncbi:MAG: type 4a pilus biogenesis protein PilO [bacterium]|nr:type 4a pilus biogenesis protein PilO [bacterium]